MNTGTNSKPGLKIMGWDDGPFQPNNDQRTALIGAVTRGGDYLEGIEKTSVSVDGFDATSQIIRTTVDSNHYPQLKLMMLDGITFGGFNVVDIEMLSAETELPVIAVTRKRTDFEALKSALENLPRSMERWNTVKKAGEPKKVEELATYFQSKGIASSEAEEIIKSTATRSKIPEPLRVADLISSKMK